VDTKVISGYSSIAKKSLLRRCASRSALPVSMLLALMVSRPLEFAGFAPSTWKVPSKSENDPRTLVTIACRALNPRRVCAGSSV
jgi:hypothetical protein